MKPAAFAYHAPTSLAEAVSLLSDLGEEAKPIAGGQSLGPMLNLRLATPSALVDLNRIGELDVARVGEDGTLVLGALARHRMVEHSSLIREGWPLLHEAMPFVGHMAIRNRGTVGGSLAHADPAAELPAVVTALAGEFHIEGPDAARRVGADVFFSTYLTTCLAPGELLREVRLPVRAPRSGHSWMEFAPRAGDYAVVGVAAVVQLDADGRYEAARLVYAGVADVPWSAEAAQLLTGERPSEELHGRVAETAAEASAPPTDVIASSAFRRRLIRVLTERALRVAVARTGGANL